MSKNQSRKNSIAKEASDKDLKFHSMPRDQQFNQLVWYYENRNPSKNYFIDSVIEHDLEAEFLSARHIRF